MLEAFGDSLQLALFKGDQMSDTEIFSTTAAEFHFRPALGAPVGGGPGWKFSFGGKVCARSGRPQSAKGVASNYGVSATDPVIKNASLLQNLGIRGRAPRKIRALTNITV